MATEKDKEIHTRGSRVNLVYPTQDFYALHSVFQPINTKQPTDPTSEPLTPPPTPPADTKKEPIEDKTDTETYLKQLKNAVVENNLEAIKNIFEKFTPKTILDLTMHPDRRPSTLINAPDEDGQTTLHLAAIHNHFTLVEYFLENNGNPNIRDKNGDIPLHTAIKSSALECIEKMLTEKNCKREIPTNLIHKHKIIAKAVHANKPNLILLINRYTNIPTRDESGEKLIDVAKDKGFTECMMALKHRIKHPASPYRQLHDLFPTKPDTATPSPYKPPPSGSSFEDSGSQCVIFNYLLTPMPPVKAHAVKGKSHKPSVHHQQAERKRRSKSESSIKSNHSPRLFNNSLGDHLEKALKEKEEKDAKVRKLSDSDKYLSSSPKQPTRKKRGRRKFTPLIFDQPTEHEKESPETSRSHRSESSDDSVSSTPDRIF